MSWGWDVKTKGKEVKILSKWMYKATASGYSVHNEAPHFHSGPMLIIYNRPRNKRRIRQIIYPLFYYNQYILYNYVHLIPQRTNPLLPHFRLHAPPRPRFPTHPPSRSAHPDH